MIVVTCTLLSFIFIRCRLGVLFLKKCVMLFVVTHNSIFCECLLSVIENIIHSSVTPIGCIIQRLVK